MSTQQHKTDSSLSNLPERNASKLTGGEGTGVVGSDQRNEGSVPTDTNNTDAKEKTPVDKHGDTWGGGVPFENKQFK